MADALRQTKGDGDRLAVVLSGKGDPWFTRFIGLDIGGVMTVRRPRARRLAAI